MRKKKRIVGIDYGVARIGISLSDEQKIIASPLTVFKAEKKIEKTVEGVLRFLEKHQLEFDYEIEEMVVGLPLLMSGKIGALADESKLFATLMGEIAPFSIKLWDERLTTVQAERSLRESSLTRKRRSQVVDTVAAVIILQNYLDHLHISRQS